MDADEAQAADGELSEALYSSVSSVEYQSDDQLSKSTTKAGKHLYASCYCQKCDGARRHIGTVKRHANLSTKCNTTSGSLSASAQLTHSRTTNVRSNLSDIDQLTQENDNSDSNHSSEIISAEDIFFEEGSCGLNLIGNNPDDVNSGDDDGDQEDCNHHQVLITADNINKAILRIIRDKIKYGWSRPECLSQLRNLFDLTGDNRIPHSSWSNVLNYLKQLGYVSPKEYKVCIHNTHVNLLDFKEDCTICGEAWTDAHTYNVIGIKPESIFLNRESILQHLAHWKDRHDWFRQESVTVPRKELWHGDRFTEISYFFDERAEFLLPTVCISCNSVISTEEIHESCGPNPVSGQSTTITCNQCFEDNNVIVKYVKGHPLNQVFIFHEDAFNAFFKRSKKITSIQLADGCVDKLNRGNTKRTFSFCPSSELPESVVHKLDAFLKPLIDEAKTYYIKGFDIELKEDIDIDGYIIKAGVHRIRCMILLGTADLKAHQEMALYAGGGRIGCRKCLVTGVYDGGRRHYYYIHFGERANEPCEERTAEYMERHGKRCDNAPNAAQHQAIRRATGVTGKTILLELHKLYKFDPIKDMVTDKMHLSFNMLKKEFLDKMWCDAGENAARPVEQRDPEVGGLLIRTELKDNLEKVLWTKEQRASGVAKIECLSEKLGGWKSDEYLKFAQVSSPVLAGIIPTEAFDVFKLASDIACMLHSRYMVVNGWDEEHVSAINALVWRHAIKAEEYYGNSICSENLEVSTHVQSDIIRHSSPDNYCCDIYERTVDYWKQQKHNAKGVDKTYGERESIRLFIKDYEASVGKLEENRPVHTNLNYNDVQGRPFFFNEPTFDSAVRAIEDASLIRGDQFVDQALGYGVLLGKLKRLRLGDDQYRDIRHMVSLLHPGVRLPRLARYTNSLAKRNSNKVIQRFSKGDTCIIIGKDQYAGQLWYAKINYFILLSIQGHYYVFVDSEFFIPIINNNIPVVNEWTRAHVLEEVHFARERLQLSSQVVRKVILYPLENNQFVPVDFEKPPSRLKVEVPFYPKTGDNVAVRGPNQVTWYGKVVRKDCVDKIADIKWYNTNDNHHLRVTNQIDQVQYCSIIRKVEVRRRPNGYELL